MFLSSAVRVGPFDGSFQTYEAISSCFADIYKRYIDCGGFNQKSSVGCVSLSNDVEVLGQDRRFAEDCT